MCATTHHRFVSPAIRLFQFLSFSFSVSSALFSLFLFCIVVLPCKSNASNSPSNRVRCKAHDLLQYNLSQYCLKLKRNEFHEFCAKWMSHVLLPFSRRIRIFKQSKWQIASAFQGKGTGSGHRTLLYGNAILLRHHNSDMVNANDNFMLWFPSLNSVKFQYLACLSTSSSNDKLSFDVGLQEHSQGEACWWTVHPASKQRSEGEKVRVGDDLILVSVATERYLVWWFSDSFWDGQNNRRTLILMSFILA